MKPLGSGRVAIGEASGRRRERRFLLTIISVAAIAALALLLAARSGAISIELRSGDLVINAEGGFAPSTLPKHEDAPITAHGGGKLSTVSGAFPPVIESINLEYDRHGHVETTGLEVCRRGKLLASTVAEARGRCPDSIVGKGQGRGVVVFPEQAPIPVSSPITIFNGPRVHGNPSVLAHFYTTVPVATAFVIPIEIERIHKGTYGYRTKAKIPAIAGGHGIPIAGHLKIGRKWTYKGVKHSFISARCETGRLQARGEFAFKDKTFLSGTFILPCKARG